MEEGPILLERVSSLYGLFRERVKSTPDATAYLHARGKVWHSLTWGEMGRQVMLLREVLAPFRGERIGLWMRNGPAWIACDQAALSLGMTVIPLYNEDRAENVAYILKDAGVKVLVVQDKGRLARIAPLLPALTCFVAEGEGATLPPWQGGSAAELPRGEEGELASIIYTSGTTGNPKGVMLTHRNILWVCSQVLQVLEVFPKDRFLSILPFSHALERAGSYIIPMMAGAEVAFNRSIPLLREDLKAVRPTVMIAVPRLFERIYLRMERELAGRPWKAKVFQAAVSLGWRRFLLQQGRGGWHPGLLAYPLVDRLVGRPFRRHMGGRLRVVVSGGARLPSSVARLFIGLGLPVLQGYGLTEASPVISVNTLEDNDPESVGRPLPGWEVRMGEDGELCVRGEGVMKGYWRRPEDTARAIDPEGWLHTGDRVKMKEGRLYIVGRLKDIIVLSNGEKVPPEDAEQAITLDTWFLQAMVVGEGRPFLSTVVVLNREAWGEMADGLDPDDPRSLHDPALQKRVIRRINARLKAFPSYAKVRGVVLTLEPWTVEEGLLTPTLKIKRYKLLERFKEAIDALYQEGLLQRAT